MENASKALIIAGSVLISMLVIAALIFTFSQVRNLRSQEQRSEETDEVAEYNNKFNKYASDNLFGVDLISLCNEVSNYNKKESDNKYYHEIDLEFNFKKYPYSSLLADDKKTYIANTKYHYTRDDPNDDTNLLKQYQDFQNEFNDTSNKKFFGYTVKQLAAMRYDELKNKVGESHVDDTNMNKAITKYNTLKTSFTEFKTKKFKGKIAAQDNTGRITKMEFTF